MYDGERCLESCKLGLFGLIKPCTSSVAEQDNTAITLLELCLSSQLSPLFEYEAVEVPRPHAVLEGVLYSLRRKAARAHLYV